MPCVGEQDGRADETTDFRHLAQNTVRVSDRLPNVNVLKAALIDDDLTPNRVGFDRQYVSDNDFLAQLCGRIKQRAQPPVLALKRGEALRSAAQHQILLTQILVVTKQRTVTGEPFGEGIDHLHW